VGSGTKIKEKKSLESDHFFVKSRLD